MRVTWICLLVAYGLVLVSSNYVPPKGLKFCSNNNTMVNSGKDLPTQTDPEKINATKSAEKAMGQDVAKACLDILQDMARDGNQFYVVEADASLILEAEACSTNELEVALRSENRNIPLFKYPMNNPDKWEVKRPEISDKLVWKPIYSVPFTSELCVTRTGQLRFLRFKPEMAGTYALRQPLGFNYYLNKVQEEVFNSLWLINHHVDFVYDSLEYFDGAHVRQMTPPLSPKVEWKRMYSSEPNLRYIYRSSPQPPKDEVMQALIPGSDKNGARPKYRFPPKLFKDLTIQMVWSPPKELNQFSEWKPVCGWKMTRSRYMTCAIDLDYPKMTRRLDEFTDYASLKDYYYNLKRTFNYEEGHGLSMLYLLYSLVKKLKNQLRDEAREVSERRPLYSAGFRWIEKVTSKEGAVELQKLRIPCHYTLLFHLPNKSVLREGNAGVEVYKIENTGEREQAARPCALSDPLELLRQMGQVLVAQLKRLANMIRTKRVVPQRSVVSSGKTVYMKCPVNTFEFEKPVCHLQDRQDNILWNLNGKTMRFFHAEVETGPTLNEDCALIIKDIQLNDAGEYVCFRTRKGSTTIEDTPAYRHIVEVVRPEFDPPPVEEVYFGMTICIVWNAFLLLLWSAIAIFRNFVSLLDKEPDREPDRDVWTSFFDDDPTLDDLEHDGEEDQDEESVDSADESDDESVVDLVDMKKTLDKKKTDAEEKKKDSKTPSSQGTAVEAKKNRAQHNMHRWVRGRAWGKKKKD